MHFISAITHTRKLDGKNTLETIHRQPLDQSQTDKRINLTAEKLKGKGIPGLWSPVAHQGRQWIACTSTYSVEYLQGICYTKHLSLVICHCDSPRHFHLLCLSFFLSSWRYMLN